MPDELVTQKEFARRVGVTPPAVSHALKSGRISALPSGKINYTTEVINWFRNRDTSKVRDGSEEEGSSGQPLAKAKLVKETYTAKLRQVQYEQRAKILIPKEDVAASILKYCRVVRDAVTTIPDRVSSETAASLSKYLQSVLKDSTTKAAAEKILANIKPEEIEQIIFKAWEKESRFVLENLEEGPKV